MAARPSSGPETDGAPVELSSGVERIERREPVGDELVASILAEAEEDETLSALIGVNLGPVAPNSADAPRARGRSSE